MNRRRVVITGIGIVSPIGNTTAEAWQSALEGRSGIGPITRFSTENFSARIAGELKDFDPAKFIEAKEIKKMDLFIQYSIAASQEAADQSGFLGKGLNPSKMGCIMGVGVGGLGLIEKNYDAFVAGGQRKISPFLIPGMVTNLAPGQLGIRYGLKGVNYVISSACTSATHALGEAYRMIAEGYQDLMVAGGAESAITPLGMGGFCSMKALSTRNDEPQKASRPFDKDRDGFVMGEGAAVLILEEREQAIKRGASIIAEMLGYGFSCDAFHITAPSADGEGAVNCMTMAIQQAGLSPEQVQYVNAHGTSTPFNDASETAGIKKVFGEYARNGLLVSSTKSMTGHLLGAAGAIEAAFCALSIKDKIVPPTINLDNPGEGCDLDYVPHTARKADVKVAISNSFGFGGTNATVVVGAAA